MPRKPQCVLKLLHFVFGLPLNSFSFMPYIIWLFHKDRATPNIHTRILITGTTRKGTHDFEKPLYKCFRIKI